MNRRQLVVAALVSAVLILTLAWGCNGCVSGPVPGVLTAAPDSGPAPLTVLLSMDTGDLEPDADYSWYFDDGSTGDFHTGAHDVVTPGERVYYEGKIRELTIFHSLAGGLTYEGSGKDLIITGLVK